MHIHIFIYFVLLYLLELANPHSLSDLFFTIWLLLIHKGQECKKEIISLYDFYFEEKGLKQIQVFAKKNFKVFKRRLPFNLVCLIAPANKGRKVKILNKVEES